MMMRSTFSPDKTISRAKISFSEAWAHHCRSASCEGGLRQGSEDGNLGEPTNRGNFKKMKRQGSAQRLAFSLQLPMIQWRARLSLKVCPYISISSSMIGLSREEIDRQGRSADSVASVESSRRR